MILYLIALFGFVIFVLQGPKNQKVPYSILKGMKRKEEERYQKERAAAVEVGLVRGEKVKPFKTKSLIYGNKDPKRKTEIRGIKESAVGRFRGGTLYLGKGDIARVTQPGKKKVNNGGSKSSGSRRRG